MLCRSNNCNGEPTVLVVFERKEATEALARTQSDVEHAIFNISGYEGVKSNIQARLALHVFLFFDHRVRE